MISDVEETPCRCHGGHVLFTLSFDECLFDKVDFEAWGKEKMTQSLHGKIAAEEGHNKNNASLGSPVHNARSSGFPLRLQVGHGTDRHILTRSQIEGELQRSVRLQLMQAFH